MGFLVVTAGERCCALPVAHVEEILRPLPIEAVHGAAEFVRGTSIVRGAPIPAVDLAVLLGDAPIARPTRLVSLRLGAARRVGVLVSSVLGLRRADEIQAATLPPLFGDASPVLDRLGRLDAALCTILHAARLIPDEAWKQWEAGESRA
jgi:purine-binding chemotaxis protein CheW